MNIEIKTADYQDDIQSRDIAMLLNAYAQDPMGGGKALTPWVLDNIAAELAKLPHALTLLAYVDGNAVGLMNCFEVFSTFNGKPLINIHDVYVLPVYRGQGLSQRMLSEVEQIARARGCCKLTLEVLSNNSVAKSSYNKFGFRDYELEPQAGQALFWQKVL